MSRASRCHGDSDLHTFVLHFDDFLLIQVQTTFHTQQFDWLSSSFVYLVCWSLPAAASSRHHACRSSSISIVSSACSLSSSSMAYRFLLPPFRHQAAKCPEFHTSSKLLFLPCHLSLAPCRLSFRCPSAMSSFLHLCHLCHRCAHCHPNSDFFPKLRFPLPLPLYAASSARSTILWIFLSRFGHHLSLPFRSPLEHSCRLPFHWLSGLSLRHRRSSGSVIQQALWHQCLDCEHLLFISDRAESVLKFVCPRHNAPRPVRCPFQICC